MSLVPHAEKWNDVKELVNSKPRINLGPYYSYAINHDIKHLLFTLSRYKFVSKLLINRKDISIVEIGCQESLGAIMLDQNTDLIKYTGVDQDKDAILWNNECYYFKSTKFEFIESDFFLYHTDSKFDIAMNLDVIEHIEAEKELLFLEKMAEVIKDDGVAIIGTPHINMNPYASEGSRIAHINLYDQDRLYNLMNQYFKNVFIFNMNDEMINVSFSPMACYIFGIGTGKRIR